MKPPRPIQNLETHPQRVRLLSDVPKEEPTPVSQAVLGKEEAELVGGSKK